MRQLEDVEQVCKRTRKSSTFTLGSCSTIPTGCRHFATFDAFKGYHQVKLNPESRKLTTFHTPFGRYRYVCLAMGLSSANNVFTTRYGDAFNYTIKGQRCTEDTLIYGHTSNKLARKTREFIAACSEASITLNVKSLRRLPHQQEMLRNQSGSLNCIVRISSSKVTDGH